MKKSIEQWDCFTCDEPVAITVVTGDDEESPEFYAGPAGSFIGYTTVEYDEGPSDEPEFIVCCSDVCCTEFFSTDDESDDEADETAGEGELQ